MNDHLTQLIADARLALEHIESDRPQSFRESAARVLFALADEIAEEVIRSKP
jgi:hypothetical protein